jgi:hypothetical protein
LTGRAFYVIEDQDTWNPIVQDASAGVTYGDDQASCFTLGALP